MVSCISPRINVQSSKIGPHTNPEKSTTLDKSLYAIIFKATYFVDIK